ncbi:hypothetical protein HNP38_001262 [Chryseobacterium defluvii]|uniref:Lipoprotein n=1 Tax=Chryseobacterium defluvii TaxID=160396 RepID=A0A840KEN4_9FLAO|nr:hypothetical protein [Chryseobacterium defluvii]MBB4805990.1 hypothetical protein [Chryseobacterium defluvii]
MKKNIFFLILSLLIGCKETGGKVFFNYDQIDYYYADENEKTGRLVSGKMYLEPAKYYKVRISESEFDGINNIFTEKTTTNNVYSKCMPVYRDILIFRKKGKPAGVAKICFTCGQNEIMGTFANTENFGQDGDYEKLRKILLNIRE